MIKNIIIICLILVIIYLNIDKLYKFYKNIRKDYYSSQALEVKSNLSNMKKEQELIQIAIKKNIKKLVNDKKLREVLLYSVIEGKKVRPIIVTSIYRKLVDIQDLPEYVMQCAMAIEYIHASSLVMDDIMDDDDYRRGKMSLHIRYNSTIAQLAAILLFSIGLENIFDGLDKLQKEKPDANKNISLLIGNIFSKLLHELIIGQYLDVSMPDNVFSQDKIKGIENVIHKKTSSLFEYSFVIPWILANYNKSDEELEKGIKNMTDISRKFGLMFQISDDFEDYIQDKEKSDSNMTMNYVINLGYSDAYKEYNKIVQDFKLTASNENILTKELSEIEGYLTKKVDVYYNQNYKIKKIDY